MNTRVIQMQADDIIDTLGLKAHPEGGWYKETPISNQSGSGRGDVSLIYFLLKEGETAHWHRIKDADEVWSWHAGSVLSLYTRQGDNAVETHYLGMDLAKGHRPQIVIPRGAWQAASSQSGWVLASNIVAPAFDFRSLELAPPGFEPGFGI